MTGKKAWVTDLFTDVNGVIKIIRTLTSTAAQNEELYERLKGNAVSKAKNSRWEHALEKL